jgi:hypothetical protein
MDSANAIEIEGEPLSAFSVTPMDVIIFTSVAVSVISFLFLPGPKSLN